MATGPEAPSGFDKDKFIGTVDLEMEVAHKVELFNTVPSVKDPDVLKNLGHKAYSDLLCQMHSKEVTAIIGRVLSSGRPHI